MDKGKFTKQPEIIAAIISVVGTIVGTLLIGVLLGFLEGRIGLVPVAAVITFLLLLSIWVLLALRWGQRLAGAAAAVMVVVGSITFLLVVFAQASLGIRPPPATPIAVVSITPTPLLTATPAATPTPTATPTPAPSPTPTATPSPQMGLLYSDDFSDPSSGWEVASDEQGEVGYSDGEYYVLVKMPKWTYWGTRYRIFTDFRLEVDARKVAGPDANEFGVAARLRDNDNYYVFVIASDGYYGVWKFVNRKWERLADRKTSPHINQGETTNHLTLIAQGPDFSFYVNGEHLVDVVDASFAEGLIALFVCTHTEEDVRIHFDNLEVWALP